MIFRTHIPPYPLNTFIDCFVYFKEYDPQLRIERFLPDGNIELVIDLVDTPKFIYDNHTLREIQECNNAWLSGIRTKPISIPAGEGAEMFIVFFKKGMAHHFTNMPLYEITDTVTNAELLKDKEILDLRYTIQACTSIEQKFIHAEQYFLRKYDNRATINPAIEFAINSITTKPDALTINKVQSSTGYSHKHFIKLFRHYTGVTPKSFQRIMRFQKAILDIEHGRCFNWPQLATACGYFDQSHFIDDFKHFSGFTPEEYQQLKGRDLNYIPVG